MGKAGGRQQEGRIYASRRATPAIVRALLDVRFQHAGPRGVDNRIDASCSASKRGMGLSIPSGYIPSYTAFSGRTGYIPQGGPMRTFAYPRTWFRRLKDCKRAADSISDKASKYVVPRWALLVASSRLRSPSHHHYHHPPFCALFSTSFSSSWNNSAPSSSKNFSALP